MEELNIEKINEDLSSNQSKLTVIETNKGIIIAKKQMLVETLEKYNKLGKYFKNI